MPKLQVISELLEALANVEQIVKEWLDTACELGREIPAPKGKLVYA